LVIPKSKLPSLLENIAALGSVQVALLLLPMVTLPYLTRVLGVEAWGKVAFAQIILGYFNLVINWGFSWSATRKVAAFRDDLPQLSSIFMAVWAAQWLLTLAVSGVLVLLILWVPFFQKDALLYGSGLGLIVSFTLFPNWFLIGLERMKAVAGFQFAARVLALPFYFWVIHNPGDAPWVIVINAGAGLASGLLTILWIKNTIALRWHWPTFQAVWQEMQAGAGLFASTIWISLYTTLTPAILGIVAGPTAVGYFALADRVRQVAQSALTPVSQALFPRMSHLFEHDPIQARTLLKRSGIGVVGIASLVSLGLWVAAEPIIRLLGGQSFLPAVVVLKWLSPLPLVVALSNLFGVQVMLAKGMSREVNLVLGSAGAISLLIITPLIIWNMAVGAAINLLIIEMFVTCGFFFFLCKKLGFKRVWKEIMKFFPARSLPQ
jgi:O-antigen/teichoic acid export membrane protein